MTEEYPESGVRLMDASREIWGKTGLILVILG